MIVFFPTGSFYPSQSGGPNNSIYWICQGLADPLNQQITAIIVTTNDGIMKKHNLQLNSWIDYDFGKVFYQETLVHYLPVRALFRSLSVIKKIDVIHLNSLFYPLSWTIAIMNLIFWRKPIIWSVRGELDPMALKYSTYKKKPVLKVIKKFFLQRAIFHVTSSREKDCIKSIMGENIKCVTIPNFMFLPQKEIVPKEKILLFLGRIHPIKGLDKLINALGYSKKFRHTNFKLVIAGKDQDNHKSSLLSLIDKNKLRDKVIFLGYVDGQQKQSLLSRSYFFFLPSHTENFGNVVVEALAQRTPVVASHGTPWKHLDSYKAGFWTNNDPQILAKVIDDIISMDDATYQQYSKGAYELAQKYDVRKNIDIWIDTYKSLIN